ncbi:MAG: glycosyltransferase [Acidimicrobiales bacterium]
MENLAPPVVAVIVTRDPGPWFEETLRAFAAQDYPELSVLVLDAGSADDPTPRVGAIVPQAFVRRLPENRGFGPNANEVLSMVQGASHLLLCHDDVAPDPDAVHILVEESIRSNAAVVAPKLVSWDDPTRLLHVGMAVDKGGAVVERVDHGEIDHGQHDGVRDVFLAPGGCTLVRADLFAELGGFSSEIVAMGEDLDLCWRAQVAGARVVVAPAARVRHVERLAGGEASIDSLPSAPAPAPSLQALQRRHELRAVLVGYGVFHRTRVLPQLVLLALGEIFVALLTGNRERAGAVAHAWRWNWAHRGEIRAARRAVSAYRRCSDAEVRRLQLRGSARLTAYMRRAVTHGLEVATAGAEAEQQLGDDAADDPVPERPRRQLSRPARTLLFTLLGLLVLVGTRSVLGNGFPYVSDLMPLPGWHELLRRFVESWQPTGVGTNDPTSPATAWLGVSSLLLGGASGLLQKILVLGSIPVGAWGMSRLLRPFGSQWARLAGVVTYVALPVAYDALATGRADALYLYAVSPWIVRHLARAASVAPFTEPDAATSRPWRRSTFGRALSLGVVVAFVTSLAPGAAVVTASMVLAVALGLVLSVGRDGLRPARRVLAVGAGAIAVALVLLEPWSLMLLSGAQRWQAIVGIAPAASSGPPWSELLRLAAGPIGDTPLAYGLMLTAVLSLLIGARRRLSWAGVAWTMTLGSMSIAWAEGRGWLGTMGVPTQMWLVPAGAGVALAVALGVAAFERDLPAYRFGWRQAAALVAAAAAAAGALPMVAAAGSGRWDLPQAGLGESTAFMASRTPVGGFRVLWIGESQWLPGAPMPLGDGLGYVLSEGGSPDVTASWASARPGPAAAISTDLRRAETRRTVRLGSLLAPFAVRYVVVVSGLAPAIPGFQTPIASASPAKLLAGLSQQTDLGQVVAQQGFAVYLDNDAPPEWAFHPLAVGIGPRPPTSVALPASSDGQWVPLPLAPQGTGATAKVGAGIAVLSRAPAQQWRLRASPTGAAVLGSDVYAPAIFTRTTATVTVAPAVSWSLLAARVAEVLMWLVALGALMGRRRWLDWWRRDSAGASR